MTPSFLKIGGLTTLFSAIFVSLASAQSITVGIEDFADIGTGARMNLMTTDPTGRLFVNDQNGGLFHIDRETGADTEYLNLSNDNLYPSLDLISNRERWLSVVCFPSRFRIRGNRRLWQVLHDSQFYQYIAYCRLHLRRRNLVSQRFTGMECGPDGGPVCSTRR